MSYDPESEMDRICCNLEETEKQRNDLLVRVKELEGEVAHWKSGFDQVFDKLKQRDSTLVAAREALESCKVVLPKANRNYNRMFARNTGELETLKGPYDAAIAQIDHALSQIQWVKL